MSNELDKNELLDAGINVAKKVKGGHDTLTRVLFWLTAAKIAGVITVIAILSFVAVKAYDHTMGVLKEMAMEEVTTVVKEKADVAKAKLQEAKDNADPATLGKALARLGQQVQSAKDTFKGGMLNESGFHKDAPGYCIGKDPKTADGVCEDYTDNEVERVDYMWFKLHEKEQCPSVYKTILETLKANGKITQNEKRTFGDQCDVIINSTKDIDLEEAKRSLIQ